MKAGELEEHWRRPGSTWIDLTGLAEDDTVTFQQPTSKEVPSRVAKTVLKDLIFHAAAAQ